MEEIPNAEYIKQACGGELRLLSEIYYGLEDSSLDSVAEVLNLREILGGAVAFRYLKLNCPDQFSNILNERGLYPVFDLAQKTRIGNYDNIYHWLNSNNKVKKEEMVEMAKILNPFKGKNLEERLSRLGEPVIEQAKESLRGNARTYVSPEGYDPTKSDQASVDFLLIEDRLTKATAFSKAIASLLLSYPLQYKRREALARAKRVQEELEKMAVDYFPEIEEGSEAVKVLQGED